MKYLNLLFGFAVVVNTVFAFAAGDIDAGLGWLCATCLFASDELRKYAERYRTN